MKKTIVIPAFMIALIGFAALGSIQTTQAFFGSEMKMTQIHEERMQARATEIAARLDEAVTNGTITVGQKQAIINHHTKMKEERQAERESIKDLTREERHARRESKRSEHVIWATGIGLSLDTIHEIIGGGEERGQGMHKGGMGFGK